MAKFQFNSARRLAHGASRMAVSAAMLAACAAPALAQDAPPAEEEEDAIIVSGFRASLETAISTKRNADTIVESISTEDLSALPDTSIADAISRLPGIASQRTDGQSSAINIRGLSQNLTFSTLNGREQVSPNGNRSVEFDQYPSELLAGADIYKSPKASLIEGGIGGSIELKTVRPLSKNGPEFFFNIRGQYNDRAKEIFDANEIGYRVSASYVDQFANDTIGIAIGYSRLDQADVSTRFVGFDYQGPNRDLNGDGVRDVVSFGFETEQQGGTNVRDGAFGSLQWKPSDNFEWTTDLFYSRFQTDSFGRGLRVIGPQSVNDGAGTPSGRATALTNPTVIGNALVGGTFTREVGAPTVAGGGFGLTIQGINDNQNDDNKLFTLGSNAKFTKDRMSFAFDFTYSRATSDFSNEVSAILPISSLNGGQPAVTFVSPTTPVLATNQSVSILLRGVDLPLVDFDQDQTDRSRYFLSRFGLFPFRNTDRLLAFAGNGKYDWDDGFLDSLEFGVRVSLRDASQRRVSADYGNDAGFFQFAENGLNPIALTTENSSVQCFSGAFAAAGFPCFLAVRDPGALVEAQVGPIVPDQDQQFTRNETFTISEDVFAGYGQLNIDTSLANIPVKGNIGLRVVHTDQSSTNVEVGRVTGVPTIGISFTEFLPSLNLNFSLSENDNLRFAASRAMSRAPISQLGGGVSVEFNEGENRLTGGGGGNPGLRPFIANQLDISYEHYFNRNGIINIGAFYKDLESFVVSSSDDGFDYGAAGLLPLLGQFEAFQFNAAQSGPNPPGTVGRFGGPINGRGGSVYGVETAFTYTFDFLPGALSGLGASANYSYTRSKINFEAGNSGVNLTLPLPGLSKHVANGSIFWDYRGFATRVSGRYRSNFISPQTGINQQLPFTSSEFVVDYQASYKFPQTSALKGLSVLFQANNLTDEPVRTYFGTVAQTGTLQYFGREFFLGLSYKF
jgi:iron complex outermembrane recepter protein